jgi:alkyldihydroxyacetonephosphate synthase
MSETKTLRDIIVYNELAGIVGYDHVSQNEVDKQAYASGRRRKGWPPVEPAFIVWPGTVEEVSEVLKLANVLKFPVIPYCGGAGIAKDPLFEGEVILDTKRLNKVIEINDHDLTVTTQTGVISQELEWQLNAKGLTWAHMPQSQYCSGLGGFLGARSAGALSTKYGKAEDMVLGMEVVLPTGGIMRTQAFPQSAAGPNLNRLFIGAEGTLGVITEATLRIHPMPEVRRNRGFMLPSMHAGFEAIRKVMRRGLWPSSVRLSDEAETAMMYKYEKTGSQLIMTWDGFEELVDLEERESVRIILEEGGEDLGREVGERWWDQRYTYCYPTDAGEDDPVVKAYQGKGVGGVFDTAATFTNLERVHDEMEKEVKKIKGTIFLAHFSHWYKTGGMMYPWVWNDRISSPDEVPELHYRLQKAAMTAVLRVPGCTINHHHGVGYRLGGYMKYEFSEAGHQAYQQIKRALDPNNIMNPGVQGLEWR